MKVMEFMTTVNTIESTFRTIINGDVLTVDYEGSLGTKTITQVTNKVLRTLNGKSKPDQVDWLELVSKKNDFKKFFSY